MPKAALPENEKSRLEKLHSYGILDTPAEAAFDKIVRLSSEMVGVTMALITLVDAERQWFKARCGLSLDETDRDISFCAHAIHGNEVLIVPDARQDPRFSDNPLVTGDFGLRFYVGAPLITSDGYRLGTLCAIDTVPRDVTPLQVRQLRDLASLAVDELELRLAARLSDRANAAKSIYVSALSHELRTPLNAVLGFAQLLDRANKENWHERECRSVRQILDSGQHLSGIISAASEITKIEAGLIEFKLEDMELFDLVADCATTIAPMAEKRGVRLVNRIAQHESRLIRTDKTRFRQILINLLSNAVKHSPVGDEIMIDVDFNTGQLARVCVSDRGQGIDASDQEDVFEAFYRLPSMSPEQTGTGLGLNIAKQLTEALGGRIGVDSTKGEGATFWFECPLSENKTA